MAFLTGWGRRKSKTVDGSTAGAQTNYQLQLTVYKSVGTDTSTQVYLGTNVRDDFGDVRFTDSDGTTILDYWTEKIISGVYAVIWVEIASIPASPSSTTIYIYYDNPSATSISNGTNTFLLFDDFEGSVGSVPDASKWMVYKDAYGVAQLDGSGRLKIASTDTGGFASIGFVNVYSKVDIGDNLLMEFKWQMGTQWEWYPSFYGYINAAGMPTIGNAIPSNMYAAILSSGAQYPNAAYNMITSARYSNSDTNSWNYDIINTTTAWVRIAAYGSTVKAWISYDGISWTLAGNGVAANDLPTGRIGFQGGANGDRQNDNRIDYIHVHKYALSEPTFGATGAPTIINVSSTNVDGTYTTGQTIAITVQFSDAVIVTGTPQLQLETGTIDRQANYSSGSGGTTLTFNYIIQAGDASTHLDYVATNSLTLNGGTIKDNNTNNVDLTLPSPGTAGSLGTNKNIIISTATPANITATNMIITPSETPCRVGICTVSVTVTWTNTGGSSGDFIPNITIDGTPYSSPYPLQSLGSGLSDTKTFVISGLAVDTHSICPYPN